MTSNRLRAMCFFRLAATALTRSSRSSMTSHIMAALRRKPRSNSWWALDKLSAEMPLVGLKRLRMERTTGSVVRRFSEGSFILIYHRGITAFAGQAEGTEGRAAMAKFNRGLTPIDADEWDCMNRREAREGRGGKEGLLTFTKWLRKVATTGPGRFCPCALLLTPLASQARLQSVAHRYVRSHEKRSDRCGYARPSRLAHGQKRSPIRLAGILEDTSRIAER